MTRSEAKTMLIAWKEASKSISALCRRKKQLIHRLSTTPELSGSAAVDVTIVSRDSAGNPITEPGLAYLPHGSGTSDPTARLAEQRASLKAELDELTQEVEVLEDFYMGVLRAIVAHLDEADAKILHLHYCTSNPGYTNPSGKQAYFYRLRSALDAFQRLEGLPEIPDTIKEQLEES